ncbi:MAG TPA: DUF3368 domain-containing protein [Candidatus Cloacimonetes bacterium]|nr:DUF3368 domain-containing protein [Candidatus Cloacimonadota bacterium]
MQNSSKEKGIIISLQPVIDKLIKNGFYVDEKLYEFILEIAEKNVLNR